MRIEHLLHLFKILTYNIYKFFKIIKINIFFYKTLTIFLITKLSLIKNFFWKISNFSDLYWFFYVCKDLKNLNYLLK